MIVAIMADSHDNLTLIGRGLERFRAEGAETLIHAGDYISPFAVREILKFGGPVEGCFGNNDGERAGIREIWPRVDDPPKTLSLGGRRILLVHDLEKTPPDLLKRADVVVFGHTHKPAVERVRLDDRERLHINPGETGGWLYGRATAALLDTGTLEAHILEL